MHKQQMEEKIKDLQRQITKYQIDLSHEMKFVENLQEMIDSADRQISELEGMIAKIDLYVATAEEEARIKGLTYDDEPDFSEASNNLDCEDYKYSDTDPR